VGGGAAADGDCAESAPAASGPMRARQPGGAGAATGPLRRSDGGGASDGDAPGVTPTHQDLNLEYIETLKNQI
jgi:hypothetical protein